MTVSRAVSPDQELTLADLPADLPGQNAVTSVLFAGRDGDALEVLVGDTLVYVLPWSARNHGVAGYIQDLDTFAVWPVEFTVGDVVRLLEEHEPREVSLIQTPAWLLDGGAEEPPVSWHARCRWAERVEPMADPAPHIREAWENGLQVGVSRGYGRYDPRTNVVVCYVGTCDDPVNVTTVYRLDEAAEIHDLGVSHLSRCDVCEGLVNPCETDVCRWCGARHRLRPQRRLPPGGEEGR